MKKLSLIIFLLYIATSCTNYGQLTFVSQLPKKLKENSGIVSLNDASFWVINDTENENQIYNVDLKGNIIHKLKVKNATNKNWEDLTKDEKGNVYIGDFGNNENKRKDLVIYKIPNPEIEKGKKINAEAIYFNYPEQTKFPPKKKNLFYDAEAMFYNNNYIYIVTKNRASHFSGKTLLYKVPATPGNYDAEFIGSFKTCDNEKTCRITAADISPNKKTIVLLSNGKLWVFNTPNNDNFITEKATVIDLGIYTQLESVCFLNNNKLLLSDEEDEIGNGRKLYSYTLKK